MLHAFRTFETPSPNDLIWKYMSIKNFVKMIQKESLWFYNMQNMANEYDYYEGHAPMKWVNDFDEYKKGEIDEYNEAIQPIFKKSGVIINGNKNLTLKDIFDILRPNAFILCMCISDYELYHMWENYAKQGIAVNFRYNKLQSQFLNQLEYDPYIGKVKYVDYNKPLVVKMDTIWNLFFIKRNNFESDNEFRAIILPNKYIGDQVKGIDLKVNLNDLLGNVILHPKSTSEDKETIKSCLEKNNIQTKIIFSELDKLPSN